MSQTSFGIAKGNGMRPRTGSAIAQALVNVANVAGVSSGRKISASASPWKALSETNIQEENKDDLPPTYSSVAANLAMDEVSNEEPPSGNKKNCNDLMCKDVSETIVKETGIRPTEVESDHPSHQIGAVAMANSLAESENTDKSLERLLLCGPSLEEEPTVNGGILSESPTGKHKKRLSWFGKRQDSTTESESSSAAENEEETRRKVRWLWRSAVRKSKAQRNTASKSDDLSNATSLEKLKSG